MTRAGGVWAWTSGSTSAGAGRNSSTAWVISLPGSSPRCSPDADRGMTVSAPHRVKAAISSSITTRIPGGTQLVPVKLSRRGKAYVALGDHDDLRGNHVRRQQRAQLAAEPRPVVHPAGAGAGA